MFRTFCFQKKLRWPLAAVMWLLCYPGKPAEAARTLKAVRGIQYLTSDSILLPLVRQHDLVNAFGVVNEAAALSRLRGMIDLTEPADGSAGLEVGVISADAGLAGVLTNALAEAGARLPTAKEGGEMPQAELDARQDLVVERRNEVMRLMQEYSIKADRLLVYGTRAGEVEETFEDPEIAAQWEEREDERKLFNREIAKAIEAAQKRAAEEERKAAADGRLLSEKSTAGADPAQFPDYLRARRAWEQQLAVLNHQRARQFEAEILKKRQAAVSETGGASEPTDHDAFHSPSLASRRSGKAESGQAFRAAAAEGNPDLENRTGRGGQGFLSGGILAAGLILLAVILAAALVLARWRRGLRGRDTGPGA